LNPPTHGRPVPRLIQEIDRLEREAGKQIHVKWG
jgi:hypothetical protein